VYARVRKPSHMANLGIRARNTCIQRVDVLYESAVVEMSSDPMQCAPTKTHR